MFCKLKRFLCWLDDLAEVLVFHVLFTRKNWKKTTVALLIAALAFTRGSFMPATEAVRPLPAKPIAFPTAAELAARGNVALLKGRVNAAIKDLELAVAAAPNNAYYAQRLGLAYLTAGKNTQAQWTLEGAYRLKPERTTLFYLGCVYQNLKLNDVAIGYFRQVIATDTPQLPRDKGGFEPAALAKIGECYTKKGELTRAVESLRDTIVQYPHYPHAYFYLGIAEWEQGNPDLAVERFFKVIELYPQESAAYYNIACYYSTKGIPDLALVWLEKSFRAGFAQFKHMRTDPDLDNIRRLPGYESLVAKYQRLVPRED